MKTILTKLKTQLTVLVSIILGVVGHYYGSLNFSYKKEKAEEIADKIRDEEIDIFNNQLSQISEILNKQNEILDKINNSNINKEKELTVVSDSIQKGKTNLEEGNKILEKAQTSDTFINKEEIIRQTKDKFSNEITQLNDASNKLSELIENLKVKILPDWSSFYNYLDSLSLLEESAFFHILVLSVIFIIIFNIYSVLFGNEIIKYFKLEERFPKLKIFFKLRTQFQR